MIVTIAIMGKDASDVTLSEGATLFEALQLANVDPGTVIDAKRMGQVIVLSTQLSDGDEVMVFTGTSKKMDGGSEDVVPHKGYVKANFDVIYEGETAKSENGVPVEGTKVLDIALWYAKSKGINLTALKSVLVDGVETPFTADAVDGRYTLVLKRSCQSSHDCDDEFDEEDW